jgi:hypothetical protein
VDDKAVRIPVKVGLRDGQRVQLLKKQAPRTSRAEPGRWLDLDGTEELIVNNPVSFEEGADISVGQTNRGRQESSRTP